MKVWSHNYSLRHRVLAGLFVATCVYWSVVASLTVQFNMKEVHELYDIHLAHTALALLRFNDTGTGLVTALKGEQATATIEQLFQKWPDLPQEATTGKPAFPEAQKPLPSAATATDADVVERNIAHGRTLRYQMWNGNGELMFQSGNAPDTPMTKVLGSPSAKTPRTRSGATTASGMQGTRCWQSCPRPMRIACNWCAALPSIP